MNFLEFKEISVEYDFLEVYEFLPTKFDKLIMKYEARLDPKHMKYRNIEIKELIIEVPL